MWKTRVVFIDPGAKVNSSCYCNIAIEKGRLPDIRAICHHYKWTLQQDGAPAHPPDHDGTSEKEHTNVNERHMWPPNCPAINSVDYAIWGAH